MMNVEGLVPRSLVDLARSGNHQALTYWLSCFLVPKGFRVQVSSLDTHTVKVRVLCRQSPQRERLVRFICYHLWLLDAMAIRQVHIVAQLADTPTVLWQEQVRLQTMVSPLPPTPPVQSPPRLPAAPPRSPFRWLRPFLFNQLTALALVVGYCGLAIALREPQSPPAPAQVNQALVSSLSTPLRPQADQPKLYPEATAIHTALTKLPRNFSIPAAYQGEIVYDVPWHHAQKMVALTFDDGPWPGSTDQVLTILEHYNIPATFFWVGQQLQRFPDLAKRIADAGHALGNHSWSHPTHKMSPGTVVQEYERTQRLINAMTGRDPQLFRPPGGYLNTGLSDYAQQRGAAVMMWSADSQDYMLSAPRLTHNVLSQTRPGGIILMHDGGGDRSATVQSLPRIISTLQQQGYHFVTVPELLQRSLEPATNATPATAAHSTPAPAPVRLERTVKLETRPGFNLPSLRIDHPDRGVQELPRL